jgi:hypothetical protein
LQRPIRFDRVDYKSARQRRRRSIRSRVILRLIRSAVAAGDKYDCRHEQDGYEFTKQDHRSRQTNYSVVIRAGSLATISGVPRNSVTVPVTHTRLSLYSTSGFPNFGRSLPR